MDETFTPSARAEMDYFGRPEEVAALRLQLETADGWLRLQLEVTLAWYLRQRDTRQALALAEQARTLLHLCDDRERSRMQARVQLVSGTAQWLLGRLDEANALLDDARARFAAAGDLVGLGDTLLARTLGGRGTSPQDLARAASAYAGAGDEVRRRVVDLRQAFAQSCVDLDAAIARWEPEFRAITELGHPGLDAMVEDFHGHAHHARGHYTLAIPATIRAHELALSIGDLGLAIGSARNVAVNHRGLQDVSTSLEWHERALKLARESGWPLMLGMLLADVGAQLADLQRDEQAAEMAAEAMRLVAPFGHVPAVAMATSGAGDIALKVRDNERALSCYRLVEQIARKHGMNYTLSASLVGQAQALSRTGRPGEAVGAIERALALAAAGVGRSIALHAYSVIARDHELPLPAGSNAPTAAIHYLSAALDTASGARPEAIPPEWLCELGHAYEGQGDTARALQCAWRAIDALEEKHNRKATDLAASLQVRFETDRAKDEAEHQRALAQAQALRADAEASANRAKGTFISNMSHELRSPLNAILGFSRLLQRSPSLSDSMQRDLGIIVRSGEHLYNLINQVLDLSKIEAGRMALNEMPADLIGMLEDLEDEFAALAAHKGLWLKMDIDRAVPREVSIDALKLRQVLNNLLTNALKFTDAGSIGVRVSAGDSQGRFMLRFEVVDTGAGIGAADLARLGAPFVQGEAGRHAKSGTGLGLAITRAFVQMMGGQLRLDSRLGEGTTARFDVRAVVMESQAVAPAAPRRVVRLAEGELPRRILVVDDKPESRQLLQRLLEPLGFEVHEACNGVEAIEASQRCKPALILMDMRMPVMDGLEATRRIKATANGRGMVVIALTASSFEEQREYILSQGCDDFLRKPFQEDDLMEKIGRHLRLRFEYETRLPQRHGAPVPDPGELARLPPSLRESLLRAVGQLDVQAVNAALEAVHGHDPTLARSLQPLVERFEYERISALLTGRGS